MSKDYLSANEIADRFGVAVSGKDFLTKKQVVDLGIIVETNSISYKDDDFVVEDDMNLSYVEFNHFSLSIINLYYFSLTIEISNQSQSFPNENLMIKVSWNINGGWLEVDYEVPRNDSSGLKRYFLIVDNFDAYSCKGFKIKYLGIKGHRSNLQNNQELGYWETTGYQRYEIDTNGNIIKSNSVLTLNINDLITGGGRKLVLLLGLLLLCGKGVER